MIQNYLKTAFRNLWLNKPYFFINLFGLALGLTCSILVFIWVQNEMSFDNHHKNAPSLYKLSFEAINQDSTKIRYTISNIAEARSLKQDIPEIVATSAYSPARTLLFKYNDNYFYEKNVRCVDSTFVRMFTFKPIYGDLKTALDDPYSIILTKKMSDKVFGTKNPIGENILVNNLDFLKVTAVIEDIPANSNLSFKMLIPVNYGIKAGFINENSNINFNYMQLKDGADYVEVNRKMNAFYNAGRPNIFKLHILTPLLEEHLYDYSTSQNTKPNIQFVYSFSLIGFFVLIIACLNFMNLSTAQSAKRKKDIGLRKVVGAGRRHIALQYLGESLLISFLALFLALLFVFLLLPLFNSLTNKDFSILYLFQAKTILGLVAITLFTGLFSGSYPALYLSAINPNKVLKGEIINSKTRFSIRHVFVILQFSITIFLIVGTVVVYRQLDYMMHTNMGFNQEQVLYIAMKGDSQRKYTKLKGELEKIPELINVTGSRFLPSDIAWNFGFRWIKDGVEQGGITHYNFVDHDWLKTMQIKFVEGRDFSREYASDTAAFIVNQEFLRLIGEQTGVGKRLEINNGGEIIGVVQDFHFKHFRTKIMPLVIWLTPRQNLNHILVRVTPNNISASVKKIETTWNTIIPDHPFEYGFIDETFGAYYNSERRMSNLFTFFCIIGIFIACLGQIGLTTFIMEQKRKEIGIRKVNGARIAEIMLSFYSSFFYWVLIAFAISGPVAYMFMHRWLQNYSYQIPISWWIFALAGTATLIIALITVSWQSYKAAVSNPVEALRSE